MADEDSKAAGPFDINTVRALVALMSRHDLSEIDLRQGEQRICLRRGPLKTTVNERLTKGPGVNGTLGRLQRVRARFYQVMLNGKPLYRYVGDRNTKGSARGNGIRSFGGTWSVVNP